MRFFIFSFLAIFACFQNAFATADGADCLRVIGVVGNDMLNIRMAPSAKAKIIGKISANATVKNSNDLECPDDGSGPAECKKRNWCRITYKGITGFANCKYLEAVDECL